MATSPRAFGLGPLETIVNVGWASGVFVCVRTFAEYQRGVVGSRSTTFTMPPALGRLVDERTITTLAQGGLKPQTVYLAVAQFNSFPKPADTQARGFVIGLRGATSYVPQYDAPMVPPFCGTTTVIWSYGPLYVTQNPFLPQWALDAGLVSWLFWQDVTAQTTSPAGTSTLAYTQPVANARYPEDVGSGASSRSASDQEIWYQDSAGNWINTHEPCSNLPPPGTPTDPTRIEGWKTVEWCVFPKQYYAPVDAATWTKDSMVTQLVALKNTADASKAFGGPLMSGEIPVRVIGQSADHTPIRDDLPDGDYEFRLAAVNFLQFPAQVPPQPKQPTPPPGQPPIPQRWELPFAYPLAPALARWLFSIGTSTPAPYKLHATLPQYDFDTPAPFLPGVLPLADQQFES